MHKESITNRQSITIMILFLFGSTLVVGSGSNAKQDAWIAIIIGTLLIIPILAIYSRLLSLYPGKDLYDILIELLGNQLGKLFILIFSWYFLHLGALVIRNFSEFIHIVSLQETPQYVIMIFMICVCIYMVKCGIEVMGRWSSFILPLVLLTIILNFLFAIKDMDFINIKPILYNGFKPVFKNAFSIFSFPLAEVVVFTTVLSALKNSKNSFKVFLISVFTASIFIIAATLRNIFILGAENASILFFPSFTAVKLISIADVIEQIEITVAVIFLLSGIIKVSICLLATSKGVSKLFNFKHHHPIIVPVGLLMITLSSIIYQSANEMVEWLEIYPYYALSFQVIIPIFILILAELKTRLRH